MNNTKNKPQKKQIKKQEKIFVYRQNKQFISEKGSIINTWALPKALLVGKETYNVLKKAMINEIMGSEIKTVFIKEHNKDVNRVIALKEFLDKLNEVYPNILTEIIGKKNLS